MKKGPNYWIKFLSSQLEITCRRKDVTNCSKANEPQLISFPYLFDGEVGVFFNKKFLSHFQMKRVLRTIWWQLFGATKSFIVPGVAKI